MKTEDLYENILATSIRMYSLYQAALSLCSVKTLKQLIEQLLIHCVTAMDVATTCLMTKDGAMHVRGAELRDSDETYLRERPEDISLLVKHFLSMFAEEMRLLHTPTLNIEALEMLVRYPFPGNIRELKNIIENALIRCGGGVIMPEHLHLISPLNRGLHIPVTESEVQTAAQVLGVDADQIHDALRDDLNTTPDVVSIPPRPQTEEDLILAYIKQNGSISNAECRDFLGADFDHASYLLRKMHRTGMLVRKGSRRAARYFTSS